MRLEHTLAMVMARQKHESRTDQHGIRLSEIRRPKLSFKLLILIRLNNLEVPRVMFVCFSTFFLPSLLMHERSMASEKRDLYRTAASALPSPLREGFRKLDHNNPANLFM
jgi:hypothetical protein